MIAAPIAAGPAWWALGAAASIALGGAVLETAYLTIFGALATVVALRITVLDRLRRRFREARRAAVHPEPAPPEAPPRT